MDISILSFRTQAEAESCLKEIGVDGGGIKIMAPKTQLCLARINKIPIFAANILKQEALSIGADAALSRDALTGRVKHTDCLIIGSRHHIDNLCEKLKIQPYGLNQAAAGLLDAFFNYRRDKFILDLGRYKLDLSSHTHIMGIMNMTPDSFSGNGLLQAADIMEYVQKLVDDGADIIDIGGESSRPGAKPVSVKEELQRVIPAIKKISKKIKVPISVDTYKSEVARQALDSGAVIVNDITALRGDPGMAKIVSKYKAGLVLMHMKGKPLNMQRNPRYHNLMREIVEYLGKGIELARGAGINFEKIVLDPGIGFGKTLEHNLRIIKSLEQLKILGRPILIGTSRKSFIGKIIGQAAARPNAAQQRLAATISSNCLSVFNGARILRVHDVKESKQALAVIDKILSA
jgi:dihydropteroate synthase